MTINPRLVVRAAVVLLGASTALAARDGWWLAKTDALNAQIAAGTPPAVADDDLRAPPELRFAQAYALAHAQPASGAQDSALVRYGLLHEAATPLGRAARYNAANLLLRRGIALQAQPAQALALVELAKEGYREVLRQDPGDWAARYNLERAQRLVPDPEGEDEDVAATPEQAERAPTTMRGYTPGLP